MIWVGQQNKQSTTRLDGKKQEEKTALFTWAGSAFGRLPRDRNAQGNMRRGEYMDGNGRREGRQVHVAKGTSLPLHQPSPPAARLVTRGCSTRRVFNVYFLESLYYCSILE